MGLGVGARRGRGLTMSGYGTGYPNYFMCSKCRVMHTGPPIPWKLTGEAKPLSSNQRIRGHSRAMRFCAGYECLKCGHRGFSRNRDVVDSASNRADHPDIVHRARPSWER
jgi:hypothetical protein